MSFFHRVSIAPMVSKVSLLQIATVSHINHPADLHSTRVPISATQHPSGCFSWLYEFVKHANICAD